MESLQKFQTVTDSLLQTKHLPLYPRVCCAGVYELHRHPHLDSWYMCLASVPLPFVTLQPVQCPLHQTLNLFQLKLFFCQSFSISKVMSQIHNQIMSLLLIDYHALVLPLLAKGYHS